MRSIHSIVLSLALLVTAAHSDGQAESPEEVLAGFEERVDQMFRTEAGKPLVRAKKRKPIGPGRGNYVRHYSYSMVGFAARCFYLAEMPSEANAALVENARHYLENPKDINDRDSFHWHAEMVMRLVELYGTQGSKHAGRITKETETLVLKPIWEYVRKSSTLAKAEYEKSQTWHIYSSENHHLMDFTVCWHFAKLAMDRPEYRDLKFDDGASAAEHYRAWNEYFVVYCRERARKGMCVEMMSDHYNSALIKGIYNFYDFGEPQVRRSAEQFLDLYFAYWAQEQIDGVQGGGRSRICFLQGLQQRFEPSMAPLAWFYFAIGEPASVYCPSLNAALSEYRPPAVVVDIAIDVSGRGRYEVRQRPPGLGQQGRSSTTAYSRIPTKMRTDSGGIMRYSYADPAFIMGTSMTEAQPLADWAHISAQNRWQGVIFAGHDDARIVPVVRPIDNWVAMNGHWSVQSKGSMITQKLKEHRGGADMIVWISDAGLNTQLEEDGVVFLEVEGAYAAIRVVNGGFEWNREKITYHGKDGRVTTSPPGKMMVLGDEYAPVILEVMARSDVRSFEEFKAKLRACEVKMDGTVLQYKTIYGDLLTFDTGYEQIPTINGKAVNYAPSKAFESPFLNGDWNSGIVTISKGHRKQVLDFNSEIPLRPGNASSGDSVKSEAEQLHEQEAFKQASAGKWQEVFFDACTGDWKEKWFLDGEVGIVKTGPDGMELTAGPEFRNDAHHMVLWTKESFKGDLKIEYEYTRLDVETIVVNILYIQATGSGEAPYVKDIFKWRDLRRVPAMRMYYDHMHTYHISYAAAPGTEEEYIRARRYIPEMNGLKGTNLKPDYFPKGLFDSGVPHKITVIKNDRHIFMRIENPEKVYYCHMTNPDLPIVTEGHIGLRHMFTRSARYRNFRISMPQK